MGSYRNGVWIEDEEGVIRPNVPKIIDARAPLADLSKNKPMTSAAPAELTGSSLTPKGIWDQIFKPKGLNGMVNASPLIQQPAQQQPTISAFGAGLQQTQTPSLTTMANGGQNHATRWTSPAPTPAVSLNQFSTTPADARAIAERYGEKKSPTPAPSFGTDYLRKNFSWASAFNR